MLVAADVDPRPGSLYGHYWVDRPPPLVLTYAAAQDALGVVGPRVLALLLAAVMVACVHDLVRRALPAADDATAPARTAALVAALLWVSPALTTAAAKGEVLGAPVAVVAAWAALRALIAPPAAAVGLGLLAGAAAATALGFKQSLVGAAVLVAVLLVGGRSWRAAAAAVVGAATVATTALVWVVAGGSDVGTAWHQLVGFRLDAAGTLAGSAAPATERAAELAGIALGSGLVLAAAVGLAARPWRAGGTAGPLAVATTAALAVDAAALVAGGSFWRSYLVPLVPWAAVLLGLGLAAAGPGRVRTAARAAVALTTAATVVAIISVQVRPAGVVGSATTYRVGQAVGAAAHHGDTVATLLGGADVVQAAGLPSAYPHLWSLPARVLDPRLADLRRTVRERGATWVVEVVPVDGWAGGPQVLRALDRRYRLVAAPCGVRVWLRADADRPPPTVTTCDERWLPWRDSLTPAPR